MGCDGFDKPPHPKLDWDQPPKQNGCVDTYPRHFGFGALDISDLFSAPEESVRIKFFVRSIMDSPLLRTFIFRNAPSGFGRESRTRRRSRELWPPPHRFSLLRKSAPAFESR
jgi:hypothetical protein